MKKREKWGNISASLDSQNAREKDTNPALPVSHETMHDNQRKITEKKQKKVENDPTMCSVPQRSYSCALPQGLLWQDSALHISHVWGQLMYL